jgi:low affinity Fe/Cu permease
MSDPAKSWQVVIHTVTSVVTLLLVALLENAGRRDSNAAQEKLNTIAGALADLMESRAAEDPELATAPRSCGGRSGWRNAPARDG